MELKEGGAGIRSDDMVSWPARTCIAFVFFSAKRFSDILSAPRDKGVASGLCADPWGWAAQQLVENHTHRRVPGVSGY